MFLLQLLYHDNIMSYLSLLIACWLIAKMIFSLSAKRTIILHNNRLMDGNYHIFHKDKSLNNNSNRLDNYIDYNSMA